LKLLQRSWSNSTSAFHLRHFLLVALSLAASRQLSAQTITMPAYSITIQPGSQPLLLLQTHGQSVFRMPLVSGLASVTDPEKLGGIEYTIRHESTGYATLTATAKSNLWLHRKFVWHFLADHIEMQQFASGYGDLGRCYFLSNGVSDRWANGYTDGFRSNTIIDADRYFSPSPNHANQTEFSIAMPQILGFGSSRLVNTEADFRPERMADLFAPPPLFLAFHAGDHWAGLGIGAHPGEYQFPALEYTGSRYAGASFYVDYMGYRKLEGDFASPVLSLHFGITPLDSLRQYTEWMRHSGFATRPAFHDARWHHLPIFCGWAEQTVESIPQGDAPNSMATQANYEHWIELLEQRHLPIGTIVIDDKWQQGYGSFDIDTAKWPDLKGFVARQHSKGRHVLLWIPVGHTDHLDDSLCVHSNGVCIMANVGKPEYEAMFRSKIEKLIHQVGADGFKVDWVSAPTAPGLDIDGSIAGLEYVHKFQFMLFSETHKWKPDAMIETQTPNVLFLDSSDVIRLNDVWYASRNVPTMMQSRASIAHISGWPLVDTDNASSTTLKEWWSYMVKQPQIGIPALYFVSHTEATQESPTQYQWQALGTIWRSYITSLQPHPTQSQSTVNP